MADAQKIIKALGQWGEPTAARHRQHVEACDKYGIEPALFETFAVEVLNTPEDKRDWLLAFEPIPESAPFVRFRQYDTPMAAEMLSGLTAGRQAGRQYVNKKKGTK